MSKKINNKLLKELMNEIPDDVKKRIKSAIDVISTVKQENGKVVVVTGSGPNIHEGVTTLIAELIHEDIVDGVLTSSAVVAHELAGSLDKVKRIPGDQLGFKLQDSSKYCLPNGDTFFLPRGEMFEFTEMDDKDLELISHDFNLDKSLMEKVDQIDGKVIIKAAGNMAYPMGPRTELLAKKLLDKSLELGEPLEKIAGLGADERTMLGAAREKNIPVLVTVPQLIGGGNVGICIADSISIKERCERIAKLLSQADVIIESALALAQEIHDGPFETYTGHGIWAKNVNEKTFSLKDKHLIRIDLDPNLKVVWEKERTASSVQSAIDEGKPKTKLFNVPFRMEMSGFARLEHSNPIVCDIGIAWPLIANGVAKNLDVNLNFMSYPQATPDGIKMRDFIADEVKCFNYRLFAKPKSEVMHPQFTPTS